MKNIIKNILKLIGLLAIVISLTQCEEELEQNPMDKISNATFWKTKKDAMQGLIGVYDGLQREALYAQRNWNNGNYTFFETFTDNAHGAFAWQGYTLMKTGGMTPLDAYTVRIPWYVNYEGIGRANRFLDNVVNIEEMQQDEMNIMIAEAKVIRSLLYFNLLVGWDDIPMPLVAQELEDVNIPKSNALTVYGQIKSDLEDAIQVLPDSWPGEYGRVTKGAAQALLSRIYLYGYGYLNVAEDLNKAATETKSIIDAGLYELFPVFQALFTPQNEKCSEVIFPIRFTQGTADDYEGFSGAANWAPCGANQPLPNLANDYYCTDGLPIDQSPLYDTAQEWLNRDPRWDATFVYTGEIWLDNRPTSEYSGSRTGYAWDKYITNDNSNNSGGRGNYGQDYYLYRYADVLLMRAEALIELNQNLSEAEDLINQVRERAGMPKIADAEVALMGLSIDQGTLRDILRHERRIELANENTRFLDLKRWGTMEQAYTNSMNDIKSGQTGPILSGITYTGEKNYILPIPTVELEVNPLLEQHPAW